MGTGSASGADQPLVEVRRSRRRRRTVSAYREDDGRVVVLLPARMSKAEEREWVATMLARLARSEERRRPSDEALARRATQLSERYLEGLARPLSVRWVENQTHRWGSCTPSDRTIRVSKRLQGMPPWVVDYVLLHELAHLLEKGHTRAFWVLVDQYPKAERAKGFLEGVAFAAAADLSPQDVPAQSAADAESALGDQAESTEVDELA